MAEFLIRTVDKVDSTHRDYPNLLGRGDVVTASADGHAWSEAERSNPEWAIVKVPGLSLAEASGFVASMRVAPGSGTVAMRRAFRIDLDKLAGKTMLTTAELLAAKVAPVAPLDPHSFMLVNSREFQ